jgi:hypothetical protein
VEDNEMLGFTAGRKFLDQASNYKLPEEDSASRSYSINISHFFGESLI